MASEPPTPATQEAIEDTVEFLEIAQKVVVLTGAGASTESGIPDFRGADGIWRRYPPGTYQDFISKPEARKRYWELRRVLGGQVLNARPNATHYALAELERMGKLSAVITQNFDGLHQDAGNAPERVIELHGTSRWAACTLCGTRSPMSELQQRVEAGEEDPQCVLCGGYLKAATILFGQPVPRAELDRAIALTRESDLFLVIGSSLRVSPASRLPWLAIEQGTPLIIINHEPTSLDRRADLVLRAKAGETMARVMTRLREKQARETA
jgi:NAD-dependent deacetylase